MHIPHPKLTGSVACWASGPSNLEKVYAGRARYINRRKKNVLLALWAGNQLSGSGIVPRKLMSAPIAPTVICALRTVDLFFLFAGCELVN